MPNRTSREEDLTNGKLEVLSDGAEVLYWRLKLVADDFGRFEADSQVLKSRCYPSRPDTKLPVALVAARYGELEAAEIVRTYGFGKVYGHFVTWDQHRRAKFSKYPAPHPETYVKADARTCSHMPADVAEDRGSRIEDRESRRDPLASPSSSEPDGAESMSSPAVVAPAVGDPAGDERLPQERVHDLVAGLTKQLIANTAKLEASRRPLARMPGRGDDSDSLYARCLGKVRLQEAAAGGPAGSGSIGIPIDLDSAVRKPAGSDAPAAPAIVGDAVPNPQTLSRTSNHQKPGPRPGSRQTSSRTSATAPRSPAAAAIASSPTASPVQPRRRRTSS